MDERDCRLLIELVRAPFGSFEAIGRRLGVKGMTVKLRLARLEQAGVFQGFVCGPSPAALGMHGRLAIYSGAPIACDARDLLLAPGVAWSARSYPPVVSALVYVDRPDAPLPEALTRLAGRAPDAVTVPDDPRAAHKPLSPLDWRVMRAVMENPRGSLLDVAASAGLSARTVRARRDRLFEDGDLMAFPSLDATQEAGAILYGAYVGVSHASDLRALRLTNAHRLLTHHSPPATFLYGFVRTYAEAHVAEEKLRALPGATRVHFTVPQGTFEARPRLRAWVDAEIRKWDRARRRPLEGTEG